MQDMKQKYQDAEDVLAGLVRVGFVTNVNNNKRIARVKYQDTNKTSDWLPVLINQNFIPDYDTPQRTEFESGGSDESAFASHKHDLIIKPWMPKINDQVLVLYMPVRNADGFILGGIQPWR